MSAKPLRSNKPSRFLRPEGRQPKATGCQTHPPHSDERCRTKRDQTARLLVLHPFPNSTTRIKDNRQGLLPADTCPERASDSAHLHHRTSVAHKHVSTGSPSMMYLASVQTSTRRQSARSADAYWVGSARAGALCLQPMRPGRWHECDTVLRHFR